MIKPPKQIWFSTAIYFAVILAACRNEPLANLPPPTASAELTEDQSADDADPIRVADQPHSVDLPKRLTTKHLPNALQLHERVLSGGQPEGAAGFAELQTLGVKTVISVDGAKPDLALAKKYGLRYVHLPHGYNGIPAPRAMELAKAVRDLESPIYIHCHHGKHRSPTAATVACVANGLLDPLATTSVLKFAGTSDNYQGLYQSAKAARQIDDSVLDAFEAAFPTTAQLPPFAEAMVNLERTYNHLKQFAATDWNPLAAHPDLDASHEALLLTEHYTEMLRLNSGGRESGAFRNMLQQSESDARQLQELLLKRRSNSVSSKEIDQSFQRIAENCTLCHQQYRDIPL